MRPNWDQYFMNMAALVSSRSTCIRRQVGAVAVLDRRVLATGYNGAPSGSEHCRKVGCLREELGVPPGERHELCRAVHAEQNLICQAATFGIKLAGADVFCTTAPCSICAKMLVNVCVNRVVYLDGYPDEMATKILAYRLKRIGNETV